MLLHAPSGHPVEATTTTTRAVVVGAVGSTQVLLEELAREPGWSVPLVVTLPSELQARHSDFVDLAPLSAHLGARIHGAARSNDPVTIATVRAARPDFVFVVGWSQLVDREFLEIAAEGTIGYHPAPLPRLRGRAAIPWTILLGEPISASSLFWIGEGTDDGDLVAQHFFHLAENETAGTLYAKHMDALRLMLRDVLPQLANGTRPRTPQDGRYATWAARRTAADGEIEWRQDAAAIDRLIRAVSAPYPGAFTHMGSHRMIVGASRLVHDAGRHHARPGQIVAKNGSVLLVQTGAGLIELVEWSIDGGRAPALHSVLRNG